MKSAKTNWPVITHYKSERTEKDAKALPIGRIDYLSTDGRAWWRESAEYFDPVQFQKDITAECEYGVPMNVVLYADKNGKTIPHPATRSHIFVIPNPYLEASIFTDLAKGFIDEYMQEEFGCEEKADYTNLSAIPVAYTTTEDDKHEVQTYVNLTDLQIITQVDGKPIRIEQYPALWEMAQAGLRNLCFSDLVYVPEEYLQECA